MSASYARADSVAEAIRLGGQAGAAFLAGGTDQMQLWKAGVRSPGAIVDISRLPLSGIEAENGVVSIGALARLSDVAGHPAVPPLVTEAIAASASGQVRNMATVGGNLLQRTRCVYFRGHDLPCNKRRPGSGCGAREGENRQAALFGASDCCVATHASDLAVALAALDAEVTILGPAGERRMGLGELYRLPGAAPEHDTVLAPGELITSVSVPAFEGPTTYLKIRDRASFEFAVVSVAAAVRIENGRIVEARLAAGGVAPMPWRLSAVEAALAAGAGLEDAAALAAEGARPLTRNGFKVGLLQSAVLRALQTVGAAA